MKEFNQITLILLVLIIAQSCKIKKEEKITSDSFRSEIEKLMIEKNVPALAIGIIEEGELSQLEVFGKLQFKALSTDSTSFDSINRDPAPDDAIFNIASLSKPISAYLTLTLVSNGDWDLDEPLCHYWVDPDIKDDPYLEKLTTRIVLTQQTGFDNWRWNNETGKLTFNFEPGTEVKYSGEGFEYMRLAIEHKFNKPWEELADSLLFKPFGMKDTRFLWDDDFHKRRYAIEHDIEGARYLYKQRTKNAIASDRVLTTIGDYSIFAVNVLKATGLTEEVYNDMVRSQAKVREGVAYGLCWYIMQNYDKGEAALTHTGYDPGVCTKVVILPKSKRAIIMFANGDNGFDIIERVEDEFFGNIDELSDTTNAK